MTARLEQRFNKEENITELFIDSKDGKKCICVLRLGRSASGPDVHWSYENDTTELQLQMNSVVKAINTGVIELVGED